MIIDTEIGSKKGTHTSQKKSQRFYQVLSEAANEDRSKYPAFLKAASTLEVLSWVFRAFVLLSIIAFVAPQVIDGSFSYLYTTLGISVAITFTLFFAMCKVASEASVVLIDIERHQRVTQEGILHMIKIYEFDN